MKAALTALATLMILAGTAEAGTCDEAIRKIDAALQSAEIAPDVKAQAQDMRNQAQQLCAAGNEEEGQDVLAEAASLLGIE